MNAWHALDVESALTAVESAPVGLTSAEAARRLARFGENRLPEAAPRPAWARFAAQLANPLIYLLAAAALIAIVLGELGDAVVIAVVVAINAIIGAFQEGRAEHALRALRHMTAQQVRVVRDGRELIIDAALLVPGDVIALAAGDAVVADARLLDDAALQTGEAALTGESLPVLKGREAVAADTVLADRRSMVHAGTHVTAGRARAVVVATGSRTEIGGIAALAVHTRPPPTPLSRRIERFGRQVTIAAGVVLALVMTLGLLRGMPAGEIAMIAISQVVGMVPEGLPVAMTIGLAVGVQRMARRNAIVRRLAAVETLGSTTVICSDKTGTLTRNEMTVAALYLPGRGELTVTGGGYEPVGAFREDGRTLDATVDRGLRRLLEAGVLCNDAEVRAPDDGEPRWMPVGDPTEAALITAALKAGLVPAELRARSPREAELPFDPAVKAMATQHRGPGGRTVLVKGAPEVVLGLCEDDAVSAAAHAAADRLAARALRVLAVAEIAGADIDGSAGLERFRGRARLLGLVGQIDPPRAEVVGAIARCHRAGIRVIMITGDHASTALAIARQLGIADASSVVIDGAALARLDDEALEAALAGTPVFARVHPAQKLRVVEACQRRRDVVAVTGDGVNDAPALMRADVGVAMGITGTDVAKEAAKIVITDDNFATIGAAVEEGRVVHRNIKKALLLLVTTSLAEVLTLILAMVIGLPAPFLAVQILWNNLVTEGVITVNLVMEPAEGDEMDHRPIALDEPLLPRALLRRMLVLTPVIVAVVLGWFAWRLDHGVALDAARSEAFTLLVICEWFNVLNCRSEHRSAFDRSVLHNHWLVAGLLAGNLLQVAVIFFPPANHVFHTTPFDLSIVIALGIAGSAVLWVEELRKLVRRRRMAAALQ